MFWGVKSFVLGKLCAPTREAHSRGVDAVSARSTANARPTSPGDALAARPKITISTFRPQDPPNPAGSDRCSSPSKRGRGSPKRSTHPIFQGTFDLACAVDVIIRVPLYGFHLAEILFVGEPSVYQGVPECACPFVPRVVVDGGQGDEGQLLAVVELVK
jgi:hypothetical protein